MEDRIEYVDYAKAFLIILVVLGHELNYANPAYSIIPYAFLHGFINSFHMPAFFIITGILFNTEKWNKQSWKVFLLKRTKTLLIPYVFFEMIAIFYKHFVLGSVSITDGLFRLITLRCNVGADWFLPAMFLANIFFFAYVKKLNMIWGGIMAGISLFVTWFLPNGNWWNILCRGILGFSFIFLGHILKKYLIAYRMRTILAALFITILLSAISFLYAYNSFFDCIVKNPLLFAASGLCGTYFILGNSKCIHCRWFRLIGENSLVIMGTHQLVLYTIPANSSAVWIVGTFILIGIMEVILIYLVNHFCPFFVGKN